MSTDLLFFLRQSNIRAHLYESVISDILVAINTKDQHRHDAVKHFMSNLQFLVLNSPMKRLDSSCVANFHVWERCERETLSCPSQPV